MFIAFMFIMILSIFMITILRHFAPRIGLMDIPNNRSEHSKHTAQSAGIGFFLAISMVSSFAFPKLILGHVWTTIAIFFVFFIGILDDRYDTSPYTKIFIIAFSTVLLSLDNIVIRDLGMFFGIHLDLGWFALPFTIFAVLSFTNALNLIDGLDGLAASISIVILSSFFILGYQHDDMFLMTIAGSFISALFGFLLFNWHPASIFMGDSGSLTLGFVISVLAIKSLAYLPTVSILFMAAIPIVDTLVVVLRRKRNGCSIFQADKCHMHHLLRDFFSNDTKKTVIFLVIMQISYSILGLELNKNIEEGYLLLLFALNIALFYLFLTALIERQKRNC